MSKTIVPSRLILSVNADGTIADAILQYQVNTDGAMPGTISSISAMSLLASLSSQIQTDIVTAVQGAIGVAKTAEGAT